MLLIRAQLATLALLGGVLPANLWSDTAPKVVVENLSNPAGIAVQPETGHVFVAERGAGRIVRFVEGQLQPVVVGLPQEKIEPGKASQFRPSGLEFIDRRTLVIGAAASSELDASLYIAQVPESGTEPLQLDSLLQLGPLATTKDSPTVGDFYGVATSKSAIYVCESDKEAKGWILQANIRNLKDLSKAESFGPLSRFIATQDAVNIGSPAGIALSARGEIVVGQLGAFDNTRDSQLSFYRSTDGRLLLNLDTGLFDIVAVEYGAPKPPSSKAHLYVLDLATHSPEFAGLYRLDAEFRGGKQGVRAVKIAWLDRPTAMTLGNDGSLYVTILGSQDRANGAGKVLQFESGL